MAIVRKWVFDFLIILIGKMTNPESGGDGNMPNRIKARLYGGRL